MIPERPFAPSRNRDVRIGGRCQAKRKVGSTLKNEKICVDKGMNYSMYSVIVWQQARLCVFIWGFHLNFA